jgi:hypothetical protein
MADADCRCPILLAAAEMQRMIELGVATDGWDRQGSAPAIVVARLRESHGCIGVNKHGDCQWFMAVVRQGAVTFDAKVPLIKDTREDTGQYL